MNSAEVRNYFNGIAVSRESWKQKNRGYHDDIKAFMRYHVREGATVLDIGCGPGDLLASLKPSEGLGIDISDKLIEVAKQNHPQYEYLAADAENLPARKPFDYVLLSDCIGLFPDVQKAFEQLKHVTHEDSRVLITYSNDMLEPLFKIAEKLGLKMPVPEQNWLPLEHIQNLLYLANFEVIKKGYRLLFPWQIPLLSAFLNRFVAKLPLIRNFCCYEWIIAKPIPAPKDPQSVSCTVVIPCRNEKGNIENAIKNTPLMGKETEFIFVDGHSSDGTIEAIEEVRKKYSDRKIRLIHQAGKGKYDAVKLGFEEASGDILMILDADLTVPPEDLPKFFNAMVEGKGEFINGTRLVYPMEKQAMRLLNLFGNKAFGLAFSYLLEQTFSDTLCGTKVMTRKNYEKLKDGRKYFGDFDPFGDFDLIFGASKLNLKIVELPIRYRDRVYGSTKIRRFYHGMILLKMCFVAMRKLKFV